MIVAVDIVSLAKKELNTCHYQLVSSGQNDWYPVLKSLPVVDC